MHIPIYSIRRHIELLLERHSSFLIEKSLYHKNHYGDFADALWFHDFINQRLEKDKKPVVGVLYWDDTTFGKKRKAGNTYKSPNVICHLYLE